MSVPNWLNDARDGIVYFVADEAYQRHHFRIAIERGLHQIVTHQHYPQQRTLQKLEADFSALGVQISEIAESFQGFTDALDGIGNAIDVGFSELNWHQEQTNTNLREILTALRHPAGTRAAEFRERADEMYRNAVQSRRTEDRERWTDLALDAYQEAAAYNPADFSVFMSIGTILFFEKGNSELAVSAFREAARLAEPYSGHHAVMAWTSLGYVFHNRQQPQEAFNATLEAIKLDPNGLEANFQHAVHSTAVGHVTDALRLLRKVLSADQTYLSRAISEPEFLQLSDTKQFLDQAAAKRSFYRDILQRVKRLYGLEIMHKYKAAQVAVDTSLENVSEDSVAKLEINHQVFMHLRHVSRKSPERLANDLQELLALSKTGDDEQQGMEIARILSFKSRPRNVRTAMMRSTRAAEVLQERNSRLN